MTKQRQEQAIKSVRQLAYDAFVLEDTINTKKWTDKEILQWNKEDIILTFHNSEFKHEEITEHNIACDYLGYKDLKIKKDELNNEN